MDKPILETIRALLKLRTDTSMAEIASMAGVPKRKVLDTILANGSLVWTNKKTGRVAKVDTTSSLRKQLWESGAFYRKGTYGAWSIEGHCIEFHGNDDLRERLKDTRTVGGLGDNYPVEIILDTPENRAAVETAGLRPWDEAVIDDRLWKEEA